MWLVLSWGDLEIGAWRLLRAERGWVTAAQQHPVRYCHWDAATAVSTCVVNSWSSTDCGRCFQFVEIAAHTGAEMQTLVGKRQDLEVVVPAAEPLAL